MKTKIKRHSRAVLSVALAVCMLVSCMAVGLIATSAAYTDGKLPSNNTADFAKNKGDASLGAKDSEDVELGAKDDSDALGVNVTGTVYIRGSFEGWTASGVAMSQKDGNYFYSVSNLATDAQFKFKNNSTEYGKNNSDSSGGKRDITGYGTSSSGYKTVEVGESTFFWKGTAGAATIWVNSDLTRTWVTSGTTADTSYAISYNDPSNGSFTTKPTSGTQGSTINVVATPNEGYQINTVSVYKTGDSSTRVSATRNGNTITFTMPSYNVTVNVTFSQVNYTITKSASNCTITAPATATYGSTVNFTVAPDTNYAIKSVTVKQGTSNVSTTKTGEGAYSFTMPAGNVTITAVCNTTVGLVSFKFKSATAWVYHPFISINGGPEVEMTLGSPVDYLDQGPKPSTVKPNSDTGSLRYAWYTATLSGVDTSKPVTITIRGQDTYMEATGTFTLESNTNVWLACDNLMEGSELVNITSLTPEQRDFYDTPLNMIDD